MALDFPNPPLTAGQIYVAPNGVTYQWNATYGVWLPASMNFAPPVDFFALNNAPANLPTGYTTITPPVASGNAGGWYNVATGRFTPPPGRYFIYTAWGAAYSSAMHFNMQLRKNGVVVQGPTWQTSATGTYYAQTMINGAYDANGTDYFDVQVQPNGGTTTAMQPMWFGAFALPGGARPDPPPPPPANVWRLIQRTPLTGQAAVDFNPLPADINDIELRFSARPATNNGNFILRFFDANGVLDATAGDYGHGNHYINHTAAQGTAVAFYGATGSQSGIVINLYSSGWGVNSTSASGIQGNLTVSNIRDANLWKYTQSQCQMLDSTGGYVGYLSGFGYRAVAGAITGLRLYFDSGNFAAVGSIALWGGP